MERVLAGRDWLAGDFSVADIAMADAMRLVDRFCGGLGAYPACRDYMNRAIARPAFVKAHADQMAHFAAADRDRAPRSAAAPAA
jgi:glutathione S-transferase